MKVAIVTPFYYPVSGGIENHVYNLNKELNKNGFYVDIYTSNGLVNSKESNNKGNIFRKRKLSFFIPKGYNVIHLHNFNILPHFLILVYYKIVNSIIKNRTKIILTPHGGGTFDGGDFTFIKKIIKKFYQRLIGNFLLKYFVDHIISVSKVEYQELLNIGINKNKVSIIGNGVEEESFQLKLFYSKEITEKYGKYLLFLGRIDSIKNIEYLISLIALIEDINLVIAGPQNDKIYYTKLLDLIEDLNLNDKIFFIGQIDKEEKYNFIDNSLALCLTSIKESEGIVIKESITRGKPVIISKNLNKNIEIVNNENGFIIEESNDIKKIVLQLGNQALLEKIKTNNLKMGLNFKWSKIIKDILLIYKN